MGQGREHWIGRRPPQPAEAPRLGHLRQMAQLLQVARLAAPVAQPLQNLQHPLGPDPAIGTLAARLHLREGQEIARDVHHAVILVQDHHPARAHDRPRGRQGLVVYRGIAERRRHAAPRRPAHLHRLELLAVGHAPADLLDDATQRHSHRHLDQSAAQHLASQGERLGALATRRPQLGQCRCTVAYQPRQHAKGLHIIDQRRSPPQAALRGIGRTKLGHAPLAFDGLDQRALLTADEGPGPLLHSQLQREVRSHDALAQITTRLRNLDGRAHPLDRQGILAPHVEEALRGTHRVGTDGDALQHAKGKRFQNHAIHKGPGVALVAVANHNLPLTSGVVHQLPLQPGGEAGAASTTQGARLDHLDQRPRTLLAQAAPQPLESLLSQIAIQIQRVQLPGMLGNQSLLAAGVATIGTATHIHRVARHRRPTLVGEQPLQ